MYFSSKSDPDSQINFIRLNSQINSSCINFIIFIIKFNNLVFHYFDISLLLFYLYNEIQIFIQCQESKKRNEIQNLKVEDGRKRIQEGLEEKVWKKQESKKSNLTFI